MIVVIATITCVPGQRDAFLSEFKKIVPEVLNELGCMEYSPTIDEPLLSDRQQYDKERITIVEKWSDLAALERHLNAPHMQEYRPKVVDFVQTTELRVLSAAC